MRYAIPEDRRADMRLGRHVNHDPESRRYAIKSKAVTAVTTHRKRLIPILDQGNLGSCTGNAMTGALGSEGVYEEIQPNLQAPLDETFAVALYSAATKLDSEPGQYPPTDTGSDGVSVSKAAKNGGWISGYTHALSFDALVTGLQSVAGIMGVNWYDSFDTPAADGTITLPATATVRGGHEIHLLNVDIERELLDLCNSWSTSWGVKGHFFMPFTVAERLLKEDGDATFPVPLSQPAPVPSDTVAWKLAAADATYLDTWSGHGWLSGFTAAKAKAAIKRHS